jgi:hypothetical protein
VNELADQPGVAIKDLELRFRVPSPSAGKYVVQARGRWGGNSDPAQAKLAFTLPSFPMFGDE